MLGPYATKDDGTINYRGNKIFSAFENVQSFSVPVEDFANRVLDFSTQPFWKHIAAINHQINITTQNFFDELGALFLLVPLITRMISSPGAVYGKEAIDYTTDTCPITLNWFDVEETGYLSESSQIYLELALCQNDISQVYCVYNSFRKEKSDATHLSEFHHIEYEGQVSQEANINIALQLVKKIIYNLLNFNEENMAFFLTDLQITETEQSIKNLEKIPRIKFKDVLELLYKETLDDKYKSFTMQNTFNSWEEIRLTEILGGTVLVTNFPLLEVPFYHSVIKGEEPIVANNADFIWAGYREFIGSGQRIQSVEELENKARIFNLPTLDYAPYIQTRVLSNYKPTSGFGMGWERMLQGILCLPFIWSGSQFPRVHSSLRP